MTPSKGRGRCNVQHVDTGLTARTQLQVQQTCEAWNRQGAPSPKDCRAVALANKQRNQPSNPTSEEAKQASQPTKKSTKQTNQPNKQQTNEPTKRVTTNQPTNKQPTGQPASQPAIQKEVVSATGGCSSKTEVVSTTRACLFKRRLFPQREVVYSKGVSLNNSNLVAQNEVSTTGGC